LNAPASLTEHGREARRSDPAEGCDAHLGIMKENKQNRQQLVARARYKRTPTEQFTEDAPVPVVLPQVVMTVLEDGTMTVTVDGAPHRREQFAPSWRREAFASILDHLTDQRRSAVRIEVHEADGTVFTDIITPIRRRPPEPEPPTTAPDLPELTVLRGTGYVPGEDVAVAVIVAHSEAASDGTARGLLTPELLALSATREVILLGRVSGVLTVGHPE
jgi:hypothetical protein